jgi:hypothetical protein
MKIEKYFSIVVYGVKSPYPVVDNVAIVKYNIIVNFSVEFNSFNLYLYYYIT